MKRAFALLLLVAAPAFAHPSVSVVIDSHGNVFYSDLEQVWRIAPDGVKSVAVPHVHTHELYLDAGDNLYGEDLWYEGDTTKKFDHYFWRRSPDGRIDIVQPAHQTFVGEADLPFYRDAAGNGYGRDMEGHTIYKTTPDGRRSVLVRAPFRDMRWMNVTADGTVYLIDTVDLMRISPDGRVVPVARGLSSRSLLRPWTGDRHRIMGVWFDRTGNVYVADYAGANVKRIDARGRVTVIARSSYPWSPTGGAFDRNGKLWLLEYSVNSARVRRLE
jgi:hypothetical protein